MYFILIRYILNDFIAIMRVIDILSTFSTSIIKQNIDIDIDKHQWNLKHHLLNCGLS